MYKVIIVDDEVISRIGIKGLIDWKKYGFTLAGQATNGIEALELVEKERPDLILTDMRMPKLDGIGLMKACREKGEPVDFVVISAHDDFMYLKEAMKLGAIDYILKNNINEEQLVTVLSRCRHKLDEQTDRPIKKSEFIETEVLHAVQQNFLKILLYGKDKEIPDVNTIWKQYQINFKKSMFVCFLIRGGQQIEEIDFTTIVDLVSNVAKDYENIYLCQTGYKELSILHNMDNMSEAENKDYLMRLANRFIFVINQYLNLNISVGISELLSGIGSIPLTYLEAYQASSSDYNISREIGAVFYKDIREIMDKVQHTTVEKSIRTFRRAIESEDHKVINEEFITIIQTFKGDERITKGQVQYYISAFIYDIKEYAHRKSYYRIIKAIRQIEETDILHKHLRKNDMVDLLKDLKIKLEEDMKDREDTSLYVVKIKEYVRNHYMDRLNIEDLAHKVGLSYTYMSSLFKKETGQTIQEYIIGIRLMHAKRYLNETNLQISHIAAQIGYDNEHYFSRMFKSRTGMTPTAYRHNKSWTQS
ncbi:response regulator [Vallitalea pronyensis]|uniref:Stage 0 sporulation protein A homolog n=1 Tax=Vallitalea pronyensis TaxID=1348613 RepID=A0A8J8MMY7_9FIRM|nr:response regulator [Vallitalea pronyensis]QUI24459.1 response regulator [Vallitalea pronyensis]